MIDAPSTPCWIWPGSRTKLGYGRTFVNGQFRYVHRVLYEIMVGPVPDGFELDHLCINPKCFRTDHLEVVTHQVNMERAAFRRNGGVPVSQRKPRHGQRAFCIRGHHLDRDNRYVDTRGYQRCRRCAVDQKREALHALALAAGRVPGQRGHGH